MTAGSSFGVVYRPDRHATGRSLGWFPVAIVFLMATSLPAEAQRPGRRWRSAPPPVPRIQPPSNPAVQPSAPVTDASRSQASGVVKGGPSPGRKSDAKSPRTTVPPATPPTSSPADRAATSVWDGPSPFTEAWRVEHPGAWRPEEGAGEIVLAGGAREPTQVDARALELTNWTAREPEQGEIAAQSVLQASAESPAADLVVFPGADGAVPAALAPRPAPAAPAQADSAAGERIAADGTVSVLVRGKGPSGDGPAPDRRPSATVSLSQEDSSSPWLPLGAFAAVPAGGDRSFAPHVFLELSLHRDGTLRGNYFDAVSDAVQPVAGRFDRETGALTWRIGGRGAEFETTADGLAAGRVEAIVRQGTSERTWVLIGLP